VRVSYQIKVGVLDFMKPCWQDVS